jgi:hypothetical protein
MKFPGKIAKKTEKIFEISQLHSIFASRKQIKTRFI